MEKWEYLTTYLYADIEKKGAREFIRQRWPNWTKPPKFAPPAMIPELNTFGEEGWELVYMQPVAGIGDNGDVYFPGESYRYSNAYFCVFKRQKQ
jgi:hypothetical protein